MSRVLQTYQSSSNLTFLFPFLYLFSFMTGTHTERNKGKTYGKLIENGFLKKPMRILDEK